MLAAMLGALERLTEPELRVPCRKRAVEWLYAQLERRNFKRRAKLSRKQQTGRAVANNVTSTESAYPPSFYESVRQAVEETHQNAARAGLKRNWELGNILFATHGDRARALKRSRRKIVIDTAPLERKLGAASHAEVESFFGRWEGVIKKRPVKRRRRKGRPVR